MLFFRKNKELEALLLELKNDAENNYKDNAQDDFRRLTARFSELKDAGKLSARQLQYYEKEIDSYREMLKNYTHAEQGRKEIGTW
ncbi:MAG: hypothetical protein J6D46_09020 [Lachnospiraceae bacterium]|nr:hypothetical protein [Lachnospiraceae bacterium]